MSKKQRELSQALSSVGLQFEEEVKGLPGTPDFVFAQQKLVVFFHGCFWHNHSCLPEIKNQVTASQRANQANIDREQQKALLDLGYRYMIVWECEFDADPDESVRRIIDRLSFR